MRTSRLPLILLLCAAAMATPAANAQQSRRSQVAFFAWDASPRPGTGAGRAFVASALLPGAGQRLLGTDRWLAYAAVELGGWIYYLNRRDRGHELSREYRDLAWSAARDVSVGPRRDPDFEYYEALLHYEASGAYDADPARSGIQPEWGGTTFNGAVWALARSIYVPAGEEDAAPGSPGYEAALAYYREHAVPPELAWDWAGRASEHRSYAGLIDQSDRAARRATLALGVILANHLVSAVDALVTARLSGAPEAELPIGIESRVEPGVGAPRWFATIRVWLPTR